MNMLMSTLLFTVLFVHSTLFASTQTGTVEVIEVVKHKENPILIYVKNWSEEQLRLFEYEKDRANHDKDKEAKEIALAKISGMKAFQKNLNSKINKAEQSPCLEPRGLSHIMPLNRKQLNTSKLTPRPM